MVGLTPASVSLFATPLPQTASSFTADYAAPASSTGLGAAASLSPAGGQPPPTPFADLVTDAVGSVERLEGQAKAAVEGLMAGTGVDVHEAMIASQKAAMGFELVLAVRNKALAAYQSVMGMQF